ncbi:hypothetical protein [Parasphingopyxis sp.]|uniref:hypothetical protein n=1 Tax=Parasphingopyxis sp. TaxID=1920299 RepID=UPI002633E0A9|nr:hypothetical protein [Parasphingopyxis sp.]
MAFALANWKYVTMGALTLLAGWFYLEWGNAEAEADRYEMALSVSNASVDVLEAEAAERMQEARERDERARQAAEDARRDAERFARDREALTERNRALTALVRDRGDSCPADEEVLDALDNL